MCICSAQIGRLLLKMLSLYTHICIRFRNAGQLCLEIFWSYICIGKAAQQLKLFLQTRDIVFNAYHMYVIALIILHLATTMTLLPLQGVSMILHYQLSD